METTGWIKLHRKISGNAFCAGNSNKLGFWVHLLLSASHKDHSFILGNSLIHIKQGQLLTGRKVLAKHAGVSEGTVELWLDVLEKNLQQIVQQKTNKYRVITILNWKKYQVTEQQNDNRMTTDYQQNDTYKNDKNDKNITNVMDKSDVFAKRYGNADVNTVLARLSRLSPTGKLDGTDTDNRRMAHNLIQLYTLKVVLQSISNIPGSFYEGKITSVRKLKNSLNALLVSETKGGIASI